MSIPEAFVCFLAFVFGSDFVAVAALLVVAIPDKRK